MSASAHATTGLFFLGCTLFSILTDVVTKDILNSSHLPVSLTLAQFGVSSLCGLLLLHVLRLHPPQPVTLQNIRRLLPLMFFQATGFLFANYSVASVAVSFMHTVKSVESIFTAALSFLVLGHVYNASVYLSLLPMILGVSLSSLTEFSFNWWGLVTGLVSNVCFSGRSVVSEKLFQTRLYDDVNLYWIMCTGAFLLVLPIWLCTDAGIIATALTNASAAASVGGGGGGGDADVGPATTTTSPWLAPLLAILPSSSLLPSSLSTLALHSLAHTSLSSLGLKLVLCGVLHYTYNMFSFMILSRTSPLTHVVLHAVRRMIVIVFSVLWFGNMVNPTNILGMALVFVGVFWYAQAKAVHQRTQLKAKSG